jgi:hypothetical protein
MSDSLDQRYAIDILAEQCGGYVALPTEEDREYMELFADICQQFHIRYCSATETERYFVDEVMRVTWARMQEEKTGVKQNIRPAFSD